jgi:hypothetical protein
LCGDGGLRIYIGVRAGAVACPAILPVALGKSKKIFGEEDARICVFFMFAR